MSLFQILSIGIQIVTLFIGIFLAFRKSYFTEKGKNLATKEDVEEITIKVEGIKNEFIKETEKLKHELQFENQVKLSLTNDIKNSSVEVYENYNNWYNTIYNSFLDSLDFSLKNIDKVDTKIDEAYLKFESSICKLELYVKNEDMDEILTKLSKATHDFCKIVEDYFDDLADIVADEEHNVEFSQKLEDEKINLYNETDNSIRLESIKALTIMEELRDLFHELLTEKIKK